MTYPFSGTRAPAEFCVVPFPLCTLGTAGGCQLHFQESSVLHERNAQSSQILACRKRAPLVFLPSGFARTERRERDKRADSRVSRPSVKIQGATREKHAVTVTQATCKVDNVQRKHPFTTSSRCYPTPFDVRKTTLFVRQIRVVSYPLLFCPNVMYGSPQTGRGDTA